MIRGRCREEVGGQGWILGLGWVRFAGSSQVAWLTKGDRCLVLAQCHLKMGHAKGRKRKSQVKRRQLSATAPFGCLLATGIDDKQSAAPGSSYVTFRPSQWCPVPHATFPERA